MGLEASSGAPCAYNRLALGLKPMKLQRLYIRVSDEDRAAIEAAQEALGLADLSSTIRFLVRQLCHERHLPIAARPKPRKKRRRVAT